MEEGKMEKLQNYKMVAFLLLGIFLTGLCLLASNSAIISYDKKAMIIAFFTAAAAIPFMGMAFGFFQRPLTYAFVGSVSVASTAACGALIFEAMAAQTSKLVSTVQWIVVSPALILLPGVFTIFTAIMVAESLDRKRLVYFSYSAEFVFATSILYLIL